MVEFPSPWNFAGVNLTLASCSSLTSIPVSYSLVSRAACTVSPVSVVVSVIRFTSSS